MSIRAVTFDLWDTIVRDDSDEPERARRGLRSKHDERRHLCWQALNAEAAIPPERVALAFDTADAAFNLAWRGYHVTWPLAERLQVVLRGLGRNLDSAAFDDLVQAIGRMEVEIPPRPVPDVAEVLAALAGRYRLAVVSDAIVTPGRGLRELLRRHDLQRYFGGFAFSDEVGRAKPDRAMFEAAASQLGVAPDEIVHIGDRDHNDVRGAHGVGARAVLFTGSRDADAGATGADAICREMADLPGIIRRLDG